MFAYKIFSVRGASFDTDFYVLSHCSEFRDYTTKARVYYVFPSSLSSTVHENIQKLDLDFSPFSIDHLFENDYKAYSMGECPFLAQFRVRLWNECASRHHARHL